MTIAYEFDTSMFDRKIKRLANPQDDPSVQQAMVQGGLLLETTIKRFASGAPGPNVITGNYRRSWSTQTAMNRGDFVVIVGTNAPQALRLEFGFSGADRLGRVYSQAPRPHVQPGMNAAGPNIMKMINASIESLQG